ncbi:MAG: DUF5668 domain-containing protein [Patescibacteria group bacterium]|jgi:hypothetical protein
MFGMILVIVGIIWLLSNLGIITASLAQLIWPLLFIACGLWILMRPKRWYNQMWRRVESESDDKKE